MFTITSYNYTPTKTEIVQGIKGNKEPKNTFRGARGSFVIVEPATAFLTLQYDDDVNHRPSREKYNAIPVLKPLAYYVDKRLTQKKVNQICESLLWQTFEDKDELAKEIERKWDELVASKIKEAKEA